MTHQGTGVDRATVDRAQAPPPRLSRSAQHRPWTTILLWVLFCGLSGLLAADVSDRLVGGGFTASGAESELAQARTQERFGVADPDVLLLFRAQAGGPTGPALRQQVKSVVTAPAVTRLAEPLPTSPDGAPSLDASATTALVPLVLDGDTEEAKRRTLEELRSAVRPPSAVTLSYGGPIAFLDEASSRSQADLVRAELLAAPLLFVLLLLIFRGLAAAMLPLLTGAAAVVIGMAVLRVATEFTEVSAFAVNLVSMLGLGLAVDYALLILTRYRRERRRGLTAEQARAISLRTAGRTVLVTSAVVTAALAVLALFPLAFMRSLAIGGCAVVVADVAAALTLLPALMAVLGPRVDAGHGPVRWSRRSGRTKRPEGERWHTLAALVARRPALWLIACTVVLLAMAAPALRTTFGGIGEGTLPSSSASRRVAEEIRETFPALQPARIQAVVDLAAPPDSTAGKEALRTWLGRVAALPSTPRAEVTAVRGNALLVSVGATGEPDADRRTVRALRALAPPQGGSVLVGGSAATDTDMTDALSARLPLVVGLVMAVTSLLLLLVFRSVLVPVKAIVTSALSTFACLGVMTWVFQDGHLASLLGFSALGYVETTQPVVVLVVLYALSVDYELFLLARVREEYRSTGDNRHAVIAGLRDTGTVITGAAALLLVVIGALTTSSVIAIKEVGVGLFAGVLIDATLVRLFLVPAALLVAGRANWWPGRSPCVTGPSGIAKLPAPAADPRMNTDVQPPQPVPDGAGTPGSPGTHPSRLEEKR
ncbi:MMPL family transporter [Streptomyces phaeoluteigriseus]|uniref:MMPL family transporter n=1 Tax=Streptomyces phaeoluteigriseus TaxID=114686 RepID=A0ABY4Z9E1_9ACTN|nr:MMPL family transporter [Streptomyces phaeoluteigriseus]USQ85658.1 MMPL family transporter [Streptomyces phaeoluteigriseus]